MYERIASASTIDVERTANNRRLRTSEGISGGPVNWGAPRAANIPSIVRVEAYNVGTKQGPNSKIENSILRSGLIPSPRFLFLSFSGPCGMNPFGTIPPRHVHRHCTLLTVPQHTVLSIVQGEETISLMPCVSYGTRTQCACVTKLRTVFRCGGPGPGVLGTDERPSWRPIQYSGV